LPVRALLLRSLIMQNSALGERIAAGETLYGGWNVTGDMIAAGAMAAAGLDYVVVDMQHGGATERDLPALTAAIQRAGATPLARVRYAHPADISRTLDLGCAGVIVPNVDSAEQARAAVGACRFPPAGYRSGGGVLAGPGGPFCVIMVESRAAMADLEETLALPGVDGVYVGPRDLSYSLGCEMSPHDAVLRSALEEIWAACRAAGKPVGVHSIDGATARFYRENGCRLVNVASDVRAISSYLGAALAEARS
jgi:4-hydroxy-2-oxoheptanedioate aldolase